MRAWLRQVWPPGAVLLLALAGHAVAVVWQIVELRGMSWREVSEVFAVSPPFVLFPAAALYGLYRVWAFHPVFRDGYSAWLEQSPWNHTRPLPFGPVHLVAQDLLLLGISMATAIPFYGALSVLILVGFVLTYLGMLLVALLHTGEFPAAYAIGFAAGGMVLIAPGMWQFFAVAAAAYLAGYVGLRRSFKRFPWTREPSGRTVTPLPGTSPHRTGTRTGLGWQFDLLGPSAGPPETPVWKGVLKSLMIGWLFFSVMARVAASDAAHGQESDRAPIVPMLFVVGFLVAARLIEYRWPEYWPPISLAGRFATRRWIIPSYDQVLVAPLLALFAGFLLPRILKACGADWVVANSTGVTVAALCVFTLGPGRKKWQLTAEHCIMQSPPNPVRVT